jgi:5-methyltetrahydrofolate--homocysteine methyltransferase
LPPPEGNANLFAMEDAFAEQAFYLADSGVDFLHIESMTHPKEARAALRGARLGAPDAAVVISMSCRLSRGAYITPTGSMPELMLQVFQEEKADGVGINCSLSPVDLFNLVRMLVDRSDVPIFAQPTIAPDDSGPLYPREFASGVETLFALGARAVGGCCGTRPTDISAAYEITARTVPAQPRV